MTAQPQCRFESEDEWTAWVFRMARIGYAPLEEAGHQECLDRLPEGFDLSIPDDLQMLTHMVEGQGSGGLTYSP